MRRYREWAGQPKGQPEDPALCIASVPEGGRSPLSRQCGRKRGHGPGKAFCAQHGAMKDKGRYVSVPEEGGNG